jgi:hypothetical protein
VFLETLKRLIDTGELSVELKPGRPSYMVLRGTYGEHIHEAFGLSRQGVRWRFQRLVNEIYVSSFETILFIERIFGSRLREPAMRISRERYKLRSKATENSFQSADSMVSRRQTNQESAQQGDSQM